MLDELLIETFKYGRLDLLYNLRDLKNIDLQELLINEIDYFEGWEWRLYHNLNLLIVSNESELVNNEPKKFMPILNYLEKIINVFERNNNIKDRRLSAKNLDNFFVVVYCLLKELKQKLDSYNKDKKINDICNEFNKKFKNYLNIIKKKNFYLHNFSPFEENKWSSKWKFIYEEKEFVLKNIDVFIDTYFYNSNIFYKYEMNENIRYLARRMKYLKHITKHYYNKGLASTLYILSERIFFSFPYSNIYNNYKYINDLEDNVFIPELFKIKKSYDYWIFCVLPRFFVAYLLGYPVITSGEPQLKNMIERIDKFIEDNDKYFKDYGENIVKPFIELRSFGVNCGNNVYDGEIVDLSFNPIYEYNIDDIFIYFNNGVRHIFTCPEFDNLLKKQSNPYNRSLLHNFIVIKENLNFKNKLARKLKNRGIELKLSAPIKEIYQEIKEKIDKEKEFLYQEEVTNLDFPLYLTNFLNGIV